MAVLLCYCAPRWGAAEWQRDDLQTECDGRQSLHLIELAPLAPLAPLLSLSSEGQGGDWFRGTETSLCF